MRIIRLFFTFILALIAFSAFPQVDYAQGSVTTQNGYRWQCGHAPGSDLYRPEGVVIRRDAPNLRLALADLTTGADAVELETSFSGLGTLANLDWSPDCRYLFGTANGDAILWDVVNGGRIATFAAVTVKHRPYWNPRGDSLILETRGGSFLWNFAVGASPMLLDYHGDFCPTHYRYFNWEVVWDNARNQVLVAPNFVDGNLVIAYDQSSAAQIAAYDNACLQGPVKFALPDDRHVIVFTSEDEAFAGLRKAITVWDRVSGQHVTVNANQQSAVLPAQVSLSGDGRYLVLARLGTLRVWDLTALAASVRDRNPIHRHPIDANTWSVRFVGDTVVETTDFNGRAARWDVLSGARVD